MTTQELPADTKIEARGTLELGDLIRFHYFHFLHRMWWMILGVILVLLAVLAIPRVVALFPPYDELEIPNGTPLLLLLLFWSSAAMILPYTAARKIHKTQSAIQGPVVYTFSARGIDTSSSNSSSQSDWNVLWKVCETQSTFVLYPSAAAAWLVPKRFFQSAAQQDEWIHLVENAIAPKSIIKPGIVARWC